MQKNTAGQKWRVFAFQRSTGDPVTGDAAKITAKIALDYGAATALADTNPTELEDGYYAFDLSQAETNANVLWLYPESSTPGVQVVGVPGSETTVLTYTAGTPTSSVAGIFTDMNRIAYRIGDTAYDDLADIVKTRLEWLATSVEQALSRPPWNFRLASATYTEYFPAGGRIVDDVDLADYSISNDGTVIPLDQETGSSILQLSHTPVLEDGLVVYEDRSAYGGQGSSPFPAATLLTGGQDYFLDSDRAGLSTTGRLHRVAGSWSREPRSIKVTYKGGPVVAETAELGADFFEIFQEVVAACVIHNYAFWKQQQSSFESGNNGQIETSESLGKYSHSFKSPTSTIQGMQFSFGGSPEFVPDALASPLTPFVNVGGLLCR